MLLKERNVVEGRSGGGGNSGVVTHEKLGRYRWYMGQIKTFYKKTKFKIKIKGVGSVQLRW